ncbi:hypothetical protein V1291_003937 [Nitrobacteraceae bacterium AZCC 1564]
MIDYPLSEIERRITVMRQHIHAMLRHADALRGDDRQKAFNAADELTKGLDALIAERNALAHDAN